MDNAYDEATEARNIYDDYLFDVTFLDVETIDVMWTAVGLTYYEWAKDKE